MNALDLLKQEHAEVRDLLQLLADTTEADERTRTRLFGKLKEDLHNHEAIEEEIFYPTLENIAKAKEVVLEGYEEHRVVDYIIEDMSQLAVSDPSWAAKLAVAKENIEHHIEEEEKVMFKHARRSFDAEELEDLGERMQERKVQLQMASH